MQGTVLLDSRGGYYVEWYTDDDNGSGYGDNGRVARYYADRDTCYRMAEGGPPRGLKWVTPEWTPSPHAGEWF